MKIWIDADGCPVVRLTIAIAKRFDIPCVTVCDTAHVFEGIGEVITVEKGSDSADYKIANLIQKGDIAVTQDYGLAAMCLARGAYAINQNGTVFSEYNIDGLLSSRAAAAKFRRAGGRTKGPKKRSPQNDIEFEESLIKLIKEVTFQ